MRTGSLSAAVLVAAVLTLAGCGGEPTPPLPADICQTAGTALLAQLAPGVRPVAGAEDHGQYDLDRRCNLQGDIDRNDISLIVHRYPKCQQVDELTTCDLDPVKDNQKNYANQCAGEQELAGQGKGDYSEPRGLGQQACQRVESRPNETDVELLIRNGTDQINVAYRGFDGRLTAQAGVTGAQELARTLLAKLK
jgi:hypothetical protein